MSYGAGHRCDSDPMLLWLWCRLEATALIRPIAWEPPHASGAALEKTKTNKQKSVMKSLKRRDDLENKANVENNLKRLPKK